MPELAFSYAVGFFVVLIVAGIALAREAKFERSQVFALLQANLAQVGARWSHGQDTIITVKAGEAKSFSHMKTMALVALACAFLSWFGLFFYILILVSMKAVVHKRRVLVIKSALARQKFETPIEVLEHMQKFLAENS